MQTQRADPGSLASLYRRLIAVRKRTPALVYGRWEEVAAPPGVFGYRRILDGEERLVLLNFAKLDRRVDLDGDWYVEVDSASRVPESGPVFDGVVRPDQALLLRPGLPAQQVG